jgi:bacillolysin
MSANSAKPRRRWGCLTRLLIFVLFMGACYWLLLAPLPERGGDQPAEAGTSTPEAPAERVSIEGEVNPTQRAALEDLAAESGGQADVLAQNGQIRFLDAAVHVPDSVAVSAQEKAAYFFSQNSSLIQIQNPATSLFPTGSSTNEQGITTLRYEQKYKGIPIYGSSIVLTLSPNDEILSFSATYVPNLEMGIQPTIRSIEAEQIVLSALGGGDAKLFGETTLIIYAPEIWNPNQPSMKPMLSWLVLAGSESGGGVSLHIVDARTGELLDRIGLFIELGGTPDIEIRDAQGWTLEQTVIYDWNPIDLKKSKLIMDENGFVTGANQDPVAVAVQQNAHKVYSYYMNALHRDSYDGKGMLVKIYLNTQDCWPRWLKDAKGINTFTGDNNIIPVNSIFMCPEWAENIDGLAHEFTHGVIAHSSDLIYKGESAALNEAYADIFAAIIDTKDPWQLTKDMAGTQIRRRLDNPQSVDPDHPIHYDDWVTPKPGEACPTEIDEPSDCSHTNSTIWSHAFYRLAIGDGSLQPNSQGIEINKLQHIYYETMINLPSGAGFKETARLTLLKCGEFGSTQLYGITSTDCEEIRWVFAGTGLVAPMTPVPPEGPIIPLPPIPEIELPDFLDMVYGLIEDLRQAVDDLLGEWNPLRLWEPIQAELDRIRNNYWVKLLECIRNSDQACINQYWADLINAILEMIVNELNNFCSSIFIVPIVVFAISKQKRLRR